MNIFSDRHHQRKCAAWLEFQILFGIKSSFKIRPLAEVYFHFDYVNVSFKEMFFVFLWGAAVLYCYIELYCSLWLSIYYVNSFTFCCMKLIESVIQILFLKYILRILLDTSSSIIKGTIMLVVTAIFFTLKQQNW